MSSTKVDILKEIRIGRKKHFLSLYEDLRAKDASVDAAEVLRLIFISQFQ